MEDIPAYARGSFPQTLQQIRALADHARWAEERGFADKQIAVKVIFELQKLSKAGGYAHVAGTDARALVDALSAAAETLSPDNCCADLLSYYLDVAAKVKQHLWQKHLGHFEALVRFHNALAVAAADQSGQIDAQSLASRVRTIADEANKLTSGDWPIPDMQIAEQIALALEDVGASCALSVEALLGDAEMFAVGRKQQAANLASASAAVPSGIEWIARLRTDAQTGGVTLRLAREKRAKRRMSWPTALYGRLAELALVQTKRWEMEGWTKKQIDAAVYLTLLTLVGEEAFAAPMEQLTRDTCEVHESTPTNEDGLSATATQPATESTLQDYLDACIDAVAGGTFFHDWVPNVSHPRAWESETIANDLRETVSRARGSVRPKIKIEKKVSDSDEDEDEDTTSDDGDDEDPSVKADYAWLATAFPQEEQASQGDHIDQIAAFIQAVEQLARQAEVAVAEARLRDCTREAEGAADADTCGGATDSTQKQVKARRGPTTCGMVTQHVSDELRRLRKNVFSQMMRPFFLAGRPEERVGAPADEAGTKARGTLMECIDLLNRQQTWAAEVSEAFRHTRHTEQAHLFKAATEVETNLATRALKYLKAAIAGRGILPLANGERAEPLSVAEAMRLLLDNYRALGPSVNESSRFGCDDGAQVLVWLEQQLSTSKHVRVLRNTRLVEHLAALEGRVVHWIQQERRPLDDVRAAAQEVILHTTNVYGPLLIAKLSGDNTPEDLLEYASSGIAHGAHPHHAGALASAVRWLLDAEEGAPKDPHAILARLVAAKRQGAGQQPALSPEAHATAQSSIHTLRGRVAQLEKDEFLALFDNLIQFDDEIMENGKKSRPRFWPAASRLERCIKEGTFHYLCLAEGVLPADHGAKFQPQARLASLVATRGAEFLAGNESKCNRIDVIVHNIHVVIGRQNGISAQAMDYKTYESPAAGAV